MLRRCRARWRPAPVTCSRPVGNTRSCASPIVRSPGLEGYLRCGRRRAGIEPARRVPAGVSLRGAGAVHHELEPDLGDLSQTALLACVIFAATRFRFDAAPLYERGRWRCYRTESRLAKWSHVPYRTDTLGRRPAHALCNDPVRLRGTTRTGPSGGDPDLHRQKRPGRNTDRLGVVRSGRTHSRPNARPG